jgi:prolyl oligopeptidase
MDDHGKSIADSLRWLESTDDPETRAWIQAQNELTEAFLDAVAARRAIRSRLGELWNYSRRGVPFERGGRWFESRQSGMDDQPRLLVMDAPGAEGRVLLDANRFSADGTVAVSGLAVDDDGTLLAYATSAAGSDWQTWRVRDVASGADLDDVIEWSKFSSASWRKDGSGFYYGAMDPPPPGAELTAENRLPRIMFHRIGTPQDSDDAVFCADDEPEWIPSAEVSDDGRFLVVTIHRGIFPENQVRVLDLHLPGSGWLGLVSDFACKAEVVAHVDSTFYLMTDDGADRKRLVAVELTDPDRSRWREVIAETEDNLVGVRFCGGVLVCHYLSHAHSLLRVHALDGSHVRDVPISGAASLAGNHGDSEGIEGRPGSSLVHFGLTSFTESGSLWVHDLSSGATRLERASQAPFDPSGYITEQVFAKSDDGTAVPVFLTRGRELIPTGDIPVLLYGYGGFDIAVTPSFSVRHAAWLERGGVLAVANLRGGGEYGRAWYDAGRLAHKQNVFDDFCACARWLVTSGWSRPERIAISGGSNGGLLVGACLTQHPELFGAAVAEVGVFDMLRFHKFTIGWAWMSDYGDPDDPEGHSWLRRYSPLHNVRQGTRYPATMMMTGDHDDRVVPGHSFKFTAALQAAQGGDAPILVRVDTSSGHGHGKPTAKLVAEGSDMLTFLEGALGLDPS